MDSYKGKSISQWQRIRSWTAAEFWRQWWFLSQWCLNQQCVTIGERPEAIHGGWSDWGSWSECSRTCGAGVSITERQCDHPVPAFGGKFCVGERRRYRVCNTEVGIMNTSSAAHLHRLDEISSIYSYAILLTLALKFCILWSKGSTDYGINVLFNYHLTQTKT